jgi:hypothetical protein
LPPVWIYVPKKCPSSMFPVEGTNYLLARLTTVT